MKEILIFAGTTEGRTLSEALADAGIAHTLCVATEYGEIVLKEHPLVSVHRGRMNQEEIRYFLEKGDFLAVVDATHPYATVVTQNIKAEPKVSVILKITRPVRKLCAGLQAIFFLRQAAKTCSGTVRMKR